MNLDTLSAQVQTARNALEREAGNPKAATYALDAVTIPLIHIAEELTNIRKLLELQSRPPYL